MLMGVFHGHRSISKCGSKSYTVKGLEGVVTKLRQEWIFCWWVEFTQSTICTAALPSWHVLTVTCVTAHHSLKNLLGGLVAAVGSHGDTSYCMSSSVSSLGRKVRYSCHVNASQLQERVVLHDWLTENSPSRVERNTEWGPRDIKSVSRVDSMMNWLSCIANGSTVPQSAPDPQSFLAPPLIKFPHPLARTIE